MLVQLTGDLRQIVGVNRNADLLAGGEGRPGNMDEIARWLGSRVTVGADRRFEVEVPAGTVHAYARPGDWVLRLADGAALAVDVQLAAQLQLHGHAAGEQDRRVTARPTLHPTRRPS